MSRKITIFIFLCCLFCSWTYATLAARNPVVTATIDKTEKDTILIGDWITIRLQAEHQPEFSLQWPGIDEKVGELEVVEIGELDSVSRGDIKKITQFITVAAYDSGFFEIPPFQFTYTHPSLNTGKIATQAMTFPVFSLSIDPAEGIKAIKEPRDVPLTFREKMMYALMALIALLFLALIAWLVWKWTRPEEEEEEEEEILLPPHEVAFDRLRELEKARMWQQGKIKTYYTELSMILREYIENRFDILAVESTTDEIIDDLRKKRVSKKLLGKLRDLLNLADLAKFAKSKPSVNQNTQSFVDADLFIRKTKEVEELVEAEQKQLEGIIPEEK